MRDPDPRPWWWLTVEERRTLGLGTAVARSPTGLLLGDPGAPFRLEVLPRSESAPVKLGSVSLRIHGDASRADARRAIYEAARTLHARRGRGFDPSSVTLPVDAPAAEHTAPTIVDVPTVCDRACSFCHRSQVPIAERRANGSEERVDRALDGARGGVLFTGDDALSHPRIVEWVARAARLGRASVIGPAREGLVRRLAPELARAGLSSFSSGLFGGDAATHDEVAGRPGAFDALTDACDALREQGVEVELVTPLVRAVLPHLPAITARARALTGRPPALLAYVPDTEVGSTLDAQVAPYDAIREALTALGDDGPRVDALPICALPASWRHDARSRLDRTDARLAIVHPDGTCGSCSARSACPGIPTTVARAVGTRGLSPIAR